MVKCKHQADGYKPETDKHHNSDARGVMSSISNGTSLILMQTLVSVFNMAPPSPATPTSNLLEPVSIRDNSDVKCYMESGYGCFSIDAPWPKNRPVNLFPEHPDKINPNFCLFTRLNNKKCQYIQPNNTATLFESYYQPNASTFFIIHGYLQSGNNTMNENMRVELLKKTDANVIVVDWSGGSGPPYTQAVANIRLVGRAIAKMITPLKEEVGAQPSKMHLIGHGLGAHAAGYAGSILQSHFYLNIGRISGLDPAEPHFADTDPEVRLDPSDAEFVDVIHTDAAPFISGGFGIKQPVGHVDFYPNGGEVQPGCENSMKLDTDQRNFYKGLGRAVGCNHVRSYELFTESINSDCDFLGVECDSYEKYKSGHCFGCLENNCAKMGFHAAPLNYKKLAQIYLKTSRQVPFCKHHYLVEIKTSNSSRSREHGGDVGYFYLKINGTTGTSHKIKLQKTATFFAPGSTWKRVVAVSSVGEVQSISVEWYTMSNILSFLVPGDQPNKWIYLEEIKLRILETGKIIRICIGEEHFKSRKTRFFTVAYHSCQPS